MTDTFQIRPYGPGDEKAVLDLWTACRLVAPQNNPKRDIASKLKVNPEWFLVGTIEGRIIATCMAGYEGHRGWINYLAVSPPFQRKGLATAMMKAAESQLQAAGCPKINLQVRETNTDVVKFYKKIGYTPDLVLSMGKRIPLQADGNPPDGQESDAGGAI